MTDYDKWNKLKLTDVGWTAEDEYRESVTPQMLAMHQVESNERTMRAARAALAAARKEQVRLRTLSAELLRERERFDWMWVVFRVGAVAVVLAGYGALRYFVWDAATPSSSQATP